MDELNQHIDSMSISPNHSDDKSSKPPPAKKSSSLSPPKTKPRKSLNIPEGYYHVHLNRSDWIILERYQELQPIGVGAYGAVCSAVDSLTGFKVAIKKLARPFQSLIHAKRTFREIRLLKHMNHENVIGLLATSLFKSFLESYIL